MVRKIVIFALAAGVVVGGYYLGKGNWGARTVAAGKYVCEKVGASANDDIERSACRSRARQGLSQGDGDHRRIL